MPDEPNDRADESRPATRIDGSSSVDGVFAQAYEELKRLARTVRSGRGACTLETTGLVHETYLKLLPGKQLSATDGAHLKRLIARAMRQVLIDGARRRLTKKRSAPAFRVTLGDAHRPGPIGIAEIVELDRALDELRAMDERQSDVVECRFFGGLSVEETAEALDVSTATVKRDWRVARAWLAQAVGGSR